MKQSKTYTMVEGSAMIALASVLSLINIFKLPWGGSITLFSMLPIFIFSIRHGIKNGLLVSFLFSIIQLFIGISNGLFGWGLSPLMIIACIFLDYILAYTVLGIAGIFSKHSLIGNLSGITLATIIRLIIHIISGVVIWHSAGLIWEGFYTDNELLYSCIYNCAYMVPELIITLIGAFSLMKLPKTRRLILK